MDGYRVLIWRRRRAREGLLLVVEGCCVAVKARELVVGNAIGELVVECILSDGYVSTLMSCHPSFISAERGSQEFSLHALSCMILC
jgi:endonuclease/exonuclease/phosphatase (EEP) superfamily protein YafD